MVSGPRVTEGLPIRTTYVATALFPQVLVAVTEMVWVPALAHATLAEVPLGVITPPEDTDHVYVAAPVEVALYVWVPKAHRVSVPVITGVVGAAATVTCKVCTVALPHAAVLAVTEMV